MCLHMERTYFMEERQFRNQVYWITFLFSILVIWIHSLNAELYLGATKAAACVDRVERALGEGLGQVSVPGFFMVSSYLFYRNFQWARLTSKWKSRINSILIPYLLWNFLYYAGYVAATRIPAIHLLIGKPPVPFNPAAFLDALINYAYNPVFWYLYQLILLIALAPVVYPVFKRTLTGAPVLILIAFALWKGWDFPHLNMDALFYACLAAFISLHRTTWGAVMEEHPSSCRKLIITLSMAFMLLLLTCLSSPGGLLYGRPLQAVLYRVWGVGAAWFLLSFLPLPPAREWMKHSFFLYAIHFAWARLLNKAGALLLPPGPVFALATFFLMPLLMLGVSTLLVKILQSTVPSLYSLLSGNR